MDRSEARNLERQGIEPTPLHNNCSGKHAAMLLASLARDWPLATYLESRHPLQVRIRGHLAAVLDLSDGEALPAAIDGCSAPTYALPLDRLARGYARLARPGDSGLDARRVGLLERVAQAMGNHPALVAGPGRLTTHLIEVTNGRILGKEGAEGVYALANCGPEPWGAALKIADGSERARDTIVLALLVSLGALSGEERRELEARCLGPIRNHRGLEVGTIEALLGGSAARTSEQRKVSQEDRLP